MSDEAKVKADVTEADLVPATAEQAVTIRAIRGGMAMVLFRLLDDESIPFSVRGAVARNGLEGLILSRQLSTLAATRFAQKADEYLERLEARMVEIEDDGKPCDCESCKQKAERARKTGN